MIRLLLGVNVMGSGACVGQSETPYGDIVHMLGFVLRRAGTRHRTGPKVAATHPRMLFGGMADNGAATDGRSSNGKWEAKETSALVMKVRTT